MKVLHTIILILFGLFEIGYYHCKVIECGNNSKDRFESIKPDSYFESTPNGIYTGFKIEYFSSYKIIHDTVNNKTYALYCRDTEPPKDKVDGQFPIPLDKVTIKDTVRPVIAWLEMLGVRDVITSVLGNAKKVTTPCISKNIKDGKVKQVNEQPSESQILFVKELAEKLNEGSTTVPLGFDKDGYGPLQKAKWIMFLAAFFNVEKEADKIHKSINNAVLCHNHNLHKIKKKVISFTKYEANENGHYSIWQLLRTTYLSSITSVAGSTINWEVNPNNEFKGNLEDFKYSLTNSDLVINVVDYDNIRNIKPTKDKSKTKEASNQYINWIERASYSSNNEEYYPDFLKTKKLYNLDGRLNEYGYSDYYETSITRPDLLVQDIAAVQYSKYIPKYDSIWLLNMVDGSSPYLYDEKNCDTNKPTFEEAKCTIIKEGITSFDDFENANNDGGLSVGVKVIVSIAIIAFIFIIVYILFRRYKNRLPTTAIHNIHSKFPSVSGRSLYSTQNNKEPNPTKSDKFYLLESANNSFATSNLHPNHPLAKNLNYNDYEDNADDNDDLYLGKQQNVTYSLDAPFK